MNNIFSKNYINDLLDTRFYVNHPLNEKSLIIFNRKLACYRILVLLKKKIFKYFNILKNFNILNTIKIISHNIGIVTSFDFLGGHGTIKCKSELFTFNTQELNPFFFNYYIKIGTSVIFWYTEKQNAFNINPILNSKNISYGRISSNKSYVLFKLNKRTHMIYAPYCAYEKDQKVTFTIKNKFSKNSNLLYASNIKCLY